MLFKAYHEWLNNNALMWQNEHILHWYIHLYIHSYISCKHAISYFKIPHGPHKAHTILCDRYLNCVAASRGLQLESDNSAITLSEWRCTCYQDAHTFP